MTEDVVVTRSLHFKTGEASSVLAALLPAALLSRKEDGNRAFEVYQVANAPDRLFVIEIWADRDPLEAHWARPYALEVVQLFREHLVQPLEEGREIFYLFDILG